MTWPLVPLKRVFLINIWPACGETGWQERRVAVMKQESPSENETRSVRVCLLGGFQMEMAGTSVSDSLNRSSKMWNLLSYLIVHRERNVSQMELVESIWPEEERANPISALKTLLYRTRMLLVPIFGEDVEFVVSFRGGYSWNQKLSCRVDAEEFEDLCRQADSAGHSDEQRLALYRRALALYQGDFLPKLSSELWVVSLSAHYHSLYLQAVKNCGRLLLQNGLYPEMTDLCTRAVEIDSFDEEIHALLIQSYLRQGNLTAALAHYESATDFLYRNLGVKPSESLRALYREIMKERKNLETDLTVIQDGLREQEKEEGAFVCEYGFFKEAYRLEARRALRQGSCVHIALVTVSTPSGELPPLPRLNAVMDMLLDTIKSSLRKGDVISRYSGAQYVLLLPTASFEDGEIVMQRIVSAYYRRHRQKDITISYKLQQLDLEL